MSRKSQDNPKIDELLISVFFFLNKFNSIILIEIQVAPQQQRKSDEYNESTTCREHSRTSTAFRRRRRRRHLAATPLMTQGSVVP